MKLPELLHVPAIELIEPNFQSLISDTYTEEILLAAGKEAKLVVNEKGWPILLALKSGETWSGAVFVLRAPVIEIIEKFEGIDGETIEIDTETLIKAVREYYLDILCADVPPAIEDFSADRAEKVKSLLAEVWGNGAGENCLDCGCGSGLGAVALRSLGYTPVCCDIDPALLALGISKERLKKEETMCVDARYASCYLPPCPYGLALMAGTINDFTAHIWQEVLDELVETCEQVLITVESEKEAQMVSSWLAAEDRKITIFENERDAFYDRWVCLISPA